MNDDDETTAKELVATVNRLHPSTSILTATALKGRRLLGWIRPGTAYCQLIRMANHVKCLECAQSNLGNKFEDVIWTNETSV